FCSGNLYCTNCLKRKSLPTEMHHSITIRFVDTGELPVIHDLAHRIWPPTFEKILSKDQIHYMLDWMYNVEKLNQQLEQGHRFAIVEEGGTPLGFIGMEANAPEIGKLRIHKLYVLPDTQGMGLGRKPLDFAMDEARKLKLSVINLNVNRF